MDDQQTTAESCLILNFHHLAGSAWIHLAGKPEILLWRSLRHGREDLKATMFILGLLGIASWNIGPHIARVIADIDVDL